MYILITTPLGKPPVVLYFWKKVLQSIFIKVNWLFWLIVTVVCYIRWLNIKKFRKVTSQPYIVIGTTINVINVLNHMTLSLHWFSRLYKIDLYFMSWNVIQNIAESGDKQILTKQTNMKCKQNFKKAQWTHH